ncbi:hypothetical protein [Paenibacillus tundrae]|uniref:Uncharacterized protein n=1 Tax=Paenibacillus tundrae TaxID=528187 RepID=A0ABT9W7F8_9BACL|nr:hypothetical protein [Paenibacillus tundrae]MDQ0169169.1 hypothetical protein [Paenibacillus tundrae]
MAKQMKLVCMECENVQTGWTNEDGTVCNECGGKVDPVGYFDGQGSYISYGHKERNHHDIVININVAPWLEVLTQSLPKAFEEAVKAGMPVQVAHRACDEMIRRVVTTAITTDSGQG